MRIPFVKICRESGVDIQDFYKYLMRSYRNELFGLQFSVLSIFLLEYNLTGKVGYVPITITIFVLGILQLVKISIVKDVNADLTDILGYFSSRGNHDGIVIRLDSYIRLINRVKN